MRHARVRGRILTIYTSYNGYDVFLCKGVPFGGRVETLSILGVTPKNIFGRE